MHFHSAPQHARMCVHNIRMSKQNTFDMDGHGWSPNSKTMGCGDSITSPTHLVPDFPTTRFVQLFARLPRHTLPLRNATGR